ncbi:hypothetical protein EVAR_28281_1 [Eumeta japonica]|uniref:Uncharacterized protein n=1 Tax=Eumeta variegata TaxID=151549 RepID=A0A4C1VAU4_EUMVA|nr:hypothetical protein EVAR_28281_1 [Eumeta japonica]
MKGRAGGAGGGGGAGGVLRIRLAFWHKAVHLPSPAYSKTGQLGLPLAQCIDRSAASARSRNPNSGRVGCISQRRATL